MSADDEAKKAKAGERAEDAAATAGDENAAEAAATVADETEVAGEAEGAAAPGDDAAAQPARAAAPADLDALIEALAGSSRRARQDASHTLAQMAQASPEVLTADVERVALALIDALFRPEAQTRWESMDALRELAPSCPELAADSFEGAEASLFDENSARVRIAAFRLLSRVSALSPEFSDAAWPLLDEAIQCFHGDVGYRDMLAGLLELAQGQASDAAKEALVARISFDAESGRGYVKACSAEIVAAARGEELAPEPAPEPARDEQPQDEQPQDE